MPTSIVQKFKCSKCGEVFLTEEEARMCEGTHIDIAKISFAEYLPQKEGDNRYAERVYVEFSDGRVLQYERTNIGLKNFNG